MKPGLTNLIQLADVVLFAVFKTLFSNKWNDWYLNAPKLSRSLIRLLKKTKIVFLLKSKMTKAKILTLSSNEEESTESENEDENNSEPTTSNKENEPANPKQAKKK